MENPLTLDPEHNWQIALESIYLHPRFNNVPILSEDESHVRLYSVEDLKKTDERLGMVNSPIEDTKKYISLRLPYYNYTPVSLIEKLNELLMTEGSLAFQKVVFKLHDNKRFVAVYGHDTYHVYVHAKLAKSLGFAKEKTPYIKFSRQKIVSDIVLRDIKPNIIKVEINNIQPVIENDSRASVLSYHTLNMISSHLHHLQFDYPMYLTLTSNVINEFSVRLLDENNEQLKLASSLPTILKMNLRRYDGSFGEFNIVVDSTKKYADFPQNTGTHFCIPLSPPLQVDEDYVCSINSISYSTYFKTLPIPESNSYIVVTRYTTVVHAVGSITYPEGKTEQKVLATYKVPFNPKQKTFFKIEDVLEVLNEDCIVPFTMTNASAKLRHEAFESRFAKFVLDVDSLTSKSYVSVGGYGDATYDLPRELLSIIGDVTETVIDPASTRWVFTLNEPVLKNGVNIASKRKFLHPPDIISLIPQTLFIYADFIQPCMVGNLQADLLQVVAVRNEAADWHKPKYVTETIERPTWSQIRTRTLDKLCFSIRRSDGQNIAFQNEKDGVIITLTFRKKQRTEYRSNVMFL
jgi:hypothetical protein